MPLGKFLPRNLDKAWRRLVTDGGNENLKSILALMGNPGFISYWDDFVGTGAGTWPASQNWSYPATVGAGTEVIGINSAIGGTLRLTTGGTTDNSAVQTLGLNWRGTEGWYMICRAKMVSLTSAKMEIGVIDALTRDQNISVKATPTFVSTDGACFIFDTTEDTNLTFITNNAGVVGANVDAAGFTMDTAYHIFELVGQGAVVAGYVDGKLTGDGAITSTVALSPYFASVTRTGSAKSVDVDYAGMVGPRYS